MPTLFVVATPIGNLEDVTLRALRVLREVSLIAAEDTRTTRKLLAHHGIRNRLLSYNDHNKAARIPRLLHALREGDVALVSEGGTPVISDPGLDLVAAALDGGFAVTPVPGPSAVTAALAVSGLASRQFTYLGFLPRRAGERRRLFAALRDDPRTLVAFESPHRLRASLTALRDALGDRRVAVCRELTKKFEEVFRGTLSEALDRFAEPRGEFTLVIEGAPQTGVGATFRSPADGGGTDSDARGSTGSPRAEHPLPGPSTGSGRAEADADESFGAVPDLVIVDGGKGQVSAAHDVMRNMGVGHIPLAGLAKRFEELYVKDVSEPIVLPRTSQALYLVQRIRDEAHRFAITYHRKVRAKAGMRSALDTIPGVGPKRKKALLRKFGSLKGIREAGVEEIAATPGFTRSLAEKVLGGL